MYFRSSWASWKRRGKGAAGEYPLCGIEGVISIGAGDGGCGGKSAEAIGDGFEIGE